MELNKYQKEIQEKLKVIHARRLTNIFKSLILEAERDIPEGEKWTFCIKQKIYSIEKKSNEIIFELRNQKNTNKDCTSIA